MTARIVVLGSLNSDLVITVSKLPQAGETVMGDRLAVHAGGKGANQAVAAQRLGGQTSMVGRVGRDSFGESLIHNLTSNGVEASGVARDPEQPTGAALIVVESGGQNIIAVAPGANLSVGRAEVERAQSRLQAGDLLVMQLEVPIAAVEQAVEAGRRAGATILLNAAPARPLDRSVFRQLDVLVVNEREAAVLSDREAPAEAAQALHRAGAKLVAVTLGKAGCILCDDAGPRPIEPFEVDAVDSTGAGDAFVGGLLSVTLDGGTIQDAVNVGAAVAALKCSTWGDIALVDRRDVEDVLRGGPDVRR
jgi:ribokinase